MSPAHIAYRNKVFAWVLAVYFLGCMVTAGTGNPHYGLLELLAAAVGYAIDPFNLMLLLIAVLTVLWVLKRRRLHRLAKTMPRRK